MNKQFNEMKKKCDKISNEIKNMPIKDKNASPVIDGILDLKEYLKSKYKILWVTKEPNDNFEPGKKGKYGDWDMTKICMTTEKDKDTPMEKRMKIVSYFILYSLENSNKKNVREIINSFSRENVDLYTARCHTAWINIKKTPGKSTVNEKIIAEAYRENKQLLHKQISTYNPDIVLFGNTIKYFENDELINKLEKHGKYPFLWYATKKRVYINAYHPAFRSSMSTEDYVNGILQIVKLWKKQ
jgi:hypothetical protein